MKFRIKSFLFIVEQSVLPELQKSISRSINFGFFAKTLCFIIILIITIYLFIVGREIVNIHK